jgi:hypothetical protein
MRAWIYAMIALCVGCLAVAAADELPEATQARLAQAHRLAATAGTELDGVALLAVLAHDRTLPAEIRLQCLETIIARHHAAGRAPALADTVDTTLRLFPDMPVARTFELRLLAGRDLSQFAAAIPIVDVARSAHFARADAFLLAATQIQREERPDPALRAEALHWLAESLHAQGKRAEAYPVLKRLTWDYPESDWAKLARRRLVSEDYATIEDELQQ